MLEPKQIEAAIANLTAEEPLELILQLEPEHPLSERIEELAAELEAAAAGAVVVRREVEEELPGQPGMVLARRGQRSIRYLAAPEGPEAAPFVDAVSQIGTKPDAAEAWQQRVAEVKDRIEILIFIAAACPNCPHTVRAANSLSLLSPAITTTVIDAQYFPELAKKYGARSVPLTVVDGELSLTGAMRAAELAERLLARGTKEYEGQTFASLVEVGRFADAAAWLRDGRGLPHFLAAWRASALSERMGLMMVVERRLDEEVSALDPLADELIAILSSEAADAALRGDTADLLGKTGLKKAIEPLRALSTDENPDVVEIAEEAIEAIEEAGRD